MNKQWIAEEQERYNRINGIITQTQIDFINSITTIEGDPESAVAVHISIGCTSYDSHVANGMDHWVELEYIKPSQKDIVKTINEHIEYPEDNCYHHDTGHYDTFGYGYKVYITCVSREKVEQEIAKLQSLL
jgi:hypothetical protein